MKAISTLLGIAVAVIGIILYLVIWVATWAVAIWAIYHLLNYLGLIQ